MDRNEQAIERMKDAAKLLDAAETAKEEYRRGLLEAAFVTRMTVLGGNKTVCDMIDAFDVRFANLFRVTYA